MNPSPHTRTRTRTRRRRKRATTDDFREFEGSQGKRNNNTHTYTNANVNTSVNVHRLPYLIALSTVNSAHHVQARTEREREREGEGERERGGERTSVIDTLISLSTSLSNRTTIEEKTERERKLSLGQRVVSASIGALLTSLVATPMDVIKTRLQAQSQILAQANATGTTASAALNTDVKYRRHVGFPYSSALSHHTIGYTSSMIGRLQSMTPGGGGASAVSPSIECPVCEAPSTAVPGISYEYQSKLADMRGSVLAGTKSSASSPTPCRFQLHNGLMEHALPPQEGPRIMQFCKEHGFRSSSDAFIKIIKYEGITGLYNGLPPTLLMAVPATVTYFALYDEIRLKLESDFQLGQTWSPILAGSGARVVAATSIAPLELLRTKAQASIDSPNMFKAAAEEFRARGVRGFFRGLAPTLLRDVPFSAIYWVFVEKIQSEVLIPRFQHKEPSFSKSFTIAFLSGASGGAIAAILTHPFDTVKTQTQVYNYEAYNSPLSPSPNDGNNHHQHQARPRTSTIIRDIVQRDGVKGLWVGIMPRLAKIMPAAAIMLGSYEGAKRIFLSSNNVY